MAIENISGNVSSLNISSGGALSASSLIASVGSNIVAPAEGASLPSNPVDGVTISSRSTAPTIPTPQIPTQGPAEADPTTHTPQPPTKPTRVSVLI